jgi:hypothetical protein
MGGKILLLALALVMSAAAPALAAPPELASVIKSHAPRLMAKAV